MGLMNPAWLWGLTGLLIPVGIHLLSRKDIRMIRIGSLRHLEDATTRQAVRIQPHAYLLLAVRSLIVIAVTLLLAGLYFKERTAAQRWVLVEAGLADRTTWRPVIDSLVAAGYTPKDFQPGFPALTDGKKQIASPDYWSLTETLNSIQLDRCVVISRGRMQGYAGMRPGKNTNIVWLTDAPDSARFVLTTRAIGDSVTARVGSSNGVSTSFETMTFAANAATTALSAWSTQPDNADQTSIEPSVVQTPTNSGDTTTDSTKDLLRPVTVILSGTKVDDEERHVMRAVLKAIGQYSIVPIVVTETEPSRVGDGDWLIWLSADAPPATTISNLIRKDSGTGNDDTYSGGNILAPVRVNDTTTTSQYVRNQELNKGGKSLAQQWMITQSLTPSSVVRSQFTRRLATLLLGDANGALARNVKPHDLRSMPESEMFSMNAATSTETNIHPVESKSGTGILAALLVALMALERWIANRQQL